MSMVREFKKWEMPPSFVANGCNPATVAPRLQAVTPWRFFAQLASAVEQK